MFFNFSQFFANQGPNAFYEEFLKTEGLSLEQILDHDDTVTEIKKANAGLLALLQPQTARLIDYITKEPAAEAGEKEGHRYPFIANEILNSEAFLTELGKDSAMLPLIFQYLQSESPLNLTLAGYCVSLSQRMLERQGFKVLEFLLISESNYPALLLRHIENRVIAELVVSVLMINSHFPARERLLYSVAMAYEQGMKRERTVNVSFTLQEVIRRSADIGEWKSLISIFLFRETMEKLAQAVTWTETGDQVATVLTAFMSHSAFDEVVTFFTEVCEAGFRTCDALRPIAEAALTAFTAQSDYEEQPTTYGESVKPLGQHRLALIHLVNTCMRAVGSELDGLLVDHGYIGLCTKLFVAFPWHSGLHQAYEALVRTVVEDGSQILKSELMDKADLIAVLSEAAKKAELPEKHRKGYLGHVTRIANNLLSASTTSPYFHQLLDTEPWISFATAYLIPQNRTETAKYLETSRKESELSLGEVQTIEDLVAAEEKEEADNEDGFEFQVTQNCLTPEQLDARNLFNFGSEEVSSDPEVESAQGSDIYNSFNFWKMPIEDRELGELE